MRCYLVRHAQTAWNGENRLQGHSDLALNPVGRRQAERVGAFFGDRRLLGEPIGALYTSHLQRSRQTAQAIARRLGVAPTVEPAVSEIGLGAWEGLTPEEIDGRFGGAYHQWRRDPSTVTIPDGEPVVQFRRRVREAFTRMTSCTRLPPACRLPAGQAGTGRNGQVQDAGAIVIVSHGGVIATWLAEWLGADYDHVLRRVMLDNAGVSAVECGTTPPRILWVNAIHHLAPEAVTPSWDIVAPCP